MDDAFAKANGGNDSLNTSMSVASKSITHSTAPLKRPISVKPVKKANIVVGGTTSFIKSDASEKENSISNPFTFINESARKAKAPNGTLLSLFLFM